MLEVREARDPEDIALIRTLFLEYASALGIDLAFQNFDSNALPAHGSPLLHGKVRRIRIGSPQHDEPDPANLSVSGACMTAPTSH